ncbi:MAG: sec-independent protein translocase protein TatA [Psychrobacter glaciei]|jgi:sec-independent protein translocase protein TatA
MLGGISIWQLVIILVVVILIFGTKKLRTLGGDLGGAVKGFKKAINDGEKSATEQLDSKSTDAQFTETSKEKDKTK